MVEEESRVGRTVRGGLFRRRALRFGRRGEEKWARRTRGVSGALQATRDG